MVVIDASVAVKWFLQEAGTAEAAALQRSQQLIAPDLIVAEVLNSVWRNARIGKVSSAAVTNTAAQLPSLFSALIPSADLLARAATIALALDHPAYDCFYIALAERDGVDLITADRRLLGKIKGTAFEPFVKPLVP
jgi:predicted nucleic acid-binding protein